MHRPYAVRADELSHAAYYRILQIWVFTRLAYGIVVAAKKPPFAADNGTLPAFCTLPHGFIELLGSSL